MIKCNYSEPTAFMGRQRKWIANVRVTLEEAAKGSLIMLMHKYTFLIGSFNAAAATVPGDDAYGLFCISYVCNLTHYLHIVKSMF